MANPRPQHDGRFKSENNEIENPPCAVTTNEAISAIFTLIDYFEQHSSLPKVTNYLDSVRAMKWDIESSGKESLMQCEITDDLTLIC